MNKEEIIQHLGLVKHIKGGYFSETYRSDINVDTDRLGKDRSVLTSIYYMLTNDRPVDHFPSRLFSSSSLSLPDYHPIR